jgi:hypothetical protein
MAEALYKRLLRHAALGGDTPALKASQDRAARYEQYAREAAKQFNMRPGDELPSRIACLKLALESITARLIGGREIDPGALRWLSEELAKYTPPPVQPEITVTFVEPMERPLDDWVARRGETVETKQIEQSALVEAKPKPIASPAEAEVVVNEIKGQITQLQAKLKDAQQVEQYWIERFNGKALAGDRSWQQMIEPIGGGSAGNPFSSRNEANPNREVYRPLPTPDFSKG